MTIPALSTNIVVILGLVGGGLYGLFAGKQRLRILILSVYVGIVLAEQMAGALAPSLKMLGTDQLVWLLLGLPIIIFGIFGGGGHHSKHENGAAVANAIVGILTGALIISAGIDLIPPSEAAGITSQSFLALNLEQFHLWIVGLLPLVALVLGFMKREKKH